MSLISTNGGIQTEIAERLNETSSDSGVGDRYVNWINLGVQDLGSEFPIAPWLETSAVLTLAADTSRWQTSSIASNIAHIKNIRISTKNQKVKYIPKAEFDALDPKPDDIGTPTVFSVFNSEVYFYPQPETDYGAQIDLVQTDVSVSAASAVPAIPLRYIELLCKYGHMKGLQRREDWNEAQIVEQQYELLKRKMKKDLLREVKTPVRFLSNREITTGRNRYNDEITNMFFGNCR